MVAYMFKAENILVKTEASNWSESIKIVGGLLEKAGSIKSGYTDAMIQSVKDMGPYMVILPHFALAHAAPSADVIRNDFALITLRTPVLFGSPNDPVSVLLGICSVDGKSHMDSLAKIAALFMKEGILEKIIRAETREEILQIMNE
jgi:PTS system ascorbate-specific IIA component